MCASPSDASLQVKDAATSLTCFHQRRSDQCVSFFHVRFLCFPTFYFLGCRPDPRDGFEKEEYVSILLESETLPLSRFGGEPLAAGDNQLMLLNRSSSTSCIILFLVFVIDLAFRYPLLVAEWFVFIHIIRKFFLEFLLQTAPLHPPGKVCRPEPDGYRGRAISFRSRMFSSFFR